MQHGFEPIGLRRPCEELQDIWPTQWLRAASPNGGQRLLELPLIRAHVQAAAHAPRQFDTLTALARKTDDGPPAAQEFDDLVMKRCGGPEIRVHRGALTEAGQFGQGHKPANIKMNVCTKA